MREDSLQMAFNRGVISRLAVARLDLKRPRLSAEEQTNWMAHKAGPMSLRPGLQYIGATQSSPGGTPTPATPVDGPVILFEYTSGSCNYLFVPERTEGDLYLGADGVLITDSPLNVSNKSYMRIVWFQAPDVALHTIETTYESRFGVFAVEYGDWIWVSNIKSPDWLTQYVVRVNKRTAEVEEVASYTWWSIYTGYGWITTIGADKRHFAVYGVDPGVVCPDIDEFDYSWNGYYFDSNEFPTTRIWDMETGLLSDEINLPNVYIGCIARSEDTLYWYAAIETPNSVIVKCSDNHMIETIDALGPIGTEGSWSPIYLTIQKMEWRASKLIVWGYASTGFVVYRSFVATINETTNELENIVLNALDAEGDPARMQPDAEAAEYNGVVYYLATYNYTGQDTRLVGYNPTTGTIVLEWQVPITYAVENGGLSLSVSSDGKLYLNVFKQILYPTYYPNVEIEFTITFDLNTGDIALP